MKLKMYICRIVYLISLFILIYFTFITDIHYIAATAGIIFFIDGFYLVHLEKVMEKNNPNYSKKVSFILWRFLLFPWFIIM